jgi:hypothetical protein
VIVATAWKLPGQTLTMSEMSELFARLAAPFKLNDQIVRIADSKQVYRPGDGLESLHAAVSAGLHWCGCGRSSFPEILSYLCPGDLVDLNQSPWLESTESTPLVDHASALPLINLWNAGGIEFVGVKARVISARRFNQACQNGNNKADLLSHSTLGLVRDLVSSLPSIAPDGAVFCDRHGGRRYYAAPLQHYFPDWMLRVVGESKEQSSYRLALDETELDVHFTVKGDRFTPVAFSSLFAKYLRERFMESLNAYFAQRYAGAAPLKPTAGYPVDADRFLEQVAAIRAREQIADCDLIRSR